MGANATMERSGGDAPTTEGYSAGIGIAGPRAFGYDIDFVPVEVRNAVQA